MAERCPTLLPNLGTGIGIGLGLGLAVVVAYLVLRSRSAAGTASTVLYKDSYTGYNNNAPSRRDIEMALSGWRY